ncbi:MAG: hypothetical protein HKL89_05770 [Candidatus Dormibacteraeota bacterium]|nr:hypothetical protein [Candidatus Dormibacteraeota bacterium]
MDDAPDSGPGVAAGIPKAIGMVPGQPAHGPAPGRFAFVMGTGVISLALGLDRYHLLSLVFLALATAGYLELLLAEGRLLGRGLRAYGTGVATTRAALGLFAFAVATEVLASRFTVLGWSWLGVGLFCLGGVVSALLAYLVPALVALRRIQPEPLTHAGGLWLLWPVALFAVAVGASVVSRYAHFEPLAMAVLAPALWTVGVALYLPLVVMLVGRLLWAGVTLREVGPSYWITMGAAALAALTASLITTDPTTSSQLPAFLPIASAAGPGLWFLATALLPMVVGITVARTLQRDRLEGVPKELWVAVFPVGMYALASLSLGGAYPWLLAVGRVAVWAAVVVWCIDLGRGVLLRLLPET